MTNRKNIFATGMAKLKNTFAHKKEITDMKKEVRDIIKNARHIQVAVGKETLHGKRVAYMAYKIIFPFNKDKERGIWVEETLYVSDNSIIYKDRPFSDDKIVSMMAKRAAELSPERVAECKRQMKEWIKGPQKIAKDRER